MTLLTAMGAALSEGPLEQKWFDAWYDSTDEALAAKQHHDSTHSSALSRAGATADAEFARIERMARENMGM